MVSLNIFYLQTRMQKGSDTSLTNLWSLLLLYSIINNNIWSMQIITINTYNYEYIYINT